MKHIFLYGPPGVGKLTVAKGLEKRLGYSILHNHLTVDAVSPFFEFGSPVFMKLIRKFRLDIISELADNKVSGLLQTSCFSVDRPGSLEHIYDIKKIVEDAGGQVFCIQLIADPSVLATRVIQPDRANHGKLTSPDKLEEALAEIDFFAPMPSGLHTKTVRSSVLSIEETIKEVVQCIAKL
ncbi:MAG: AAA family ATPase [Myxococcales bacterium]|nr:AAA family ATPase [Myxococcales bacterium]